MDTNEIRDAIALEIQRLTAAHAALNGGAMPRKTYARRNANHGTRGAKPKRHLSAAAKLRLSRAAKARWAAAKKQGKNQL
jgi:hypothetical protein